MKPLTAARVVLFVILVLWAIPQLVLTFVSNSRKGNLVDTLLMLLLVFGLLAAYFAFSWYAGRLRKQRGLSSLYDKFDTEGIVILKWVCLGAAVFAGYWLYMGIDLLIMGLSPGMEISGLFVTEGDADGFYLLGLPITYLASAALSILISLFASASLQHRKRKRLLRRGETGA